MKVVVTGGGTGGHIYPALAFVNYLKSVEPNSEVLYIGANRGLENKILPETEIPFKTLEIQGFKRKLTFENIRTLRLFIQSIRIAKKQLKDFQPDVVIGTGGYVSGAVMYAASRLKIPTIIHEQNSVPGLTNRFLSRYVDKIAVCFDDVRSFFPEEKVVLIGNPRAQEVVGIEASNVLETYGLKSNRKTVLIFAGSQGAAKINQAVLNSLSKFSEKDYQILYVSGESYYREIEETIGLTKDAFANISIQPYLNNMPEVMTNSSLLVSRAGATTLAEVTALGLPAILIPSPYVTNDHQTKNAQSLVTVGAAEMLKDQELTEELLVDKVDKIMEDEQRRKQMSMASKQLGIPDASKRLYKLAQSLIR